MKLVWCEIKGGNKRCVWLFSFVVVSQVKNEGEARWETRLIKKIVRIQKTKCYLIFTLFCPHRSGIDCLLFTQPQIMSYNAPLIIQTLLAVVCWDAIFLASYNIFVRNIFKIDLKKFASGKNLIILSHYSEMYYFN